MLDAPKTVSLLLAFSVVSYAQQADDVPGEQTAPVADEVPVERTGPVADELPGEQNVPVADEAPGEQAVTVADEALAEQPSTDEALDSVEPDSSADGLSAEERLIQEFARYKRYIDEGSLDEADIAAKRIVEMAIRVYGPQSLETSKALNNLALVQHRTGQYDAAIQNFESSIQIIEIREDRLNDELVNPLKGLGASHLANGRPDLAVNTFERAKHITHVNEGPHNIEQVEILESLAESTLRMGDMKGARNLLDRIHVLNVRHFDNNELGLIPSLMRRADWQHRAGYIHDERATYRRAIRIVEAKLGKDDPQLIPPLLKLAESFYFADMIQAGRTSREIVATGEIYFKRAARIVERSETVEWPEYALTKLALADYYIYADAHNRARKLYAEIWEYLSVDEERLDARQDWLEQPSVFFQQGLPTRVGAPPNRGEALLNGTIRVDYDISKRGRVRNIRTVANPPEFVEMQRIVHREVRNRVFRPRLVDGTPADSDELVFEHNFLYRQADLEKLRQQPPASQQTNETSET